MRWILCLLLTAGALWSAPVPLPPASTNTAICFLAWDRNPIHDHLANYTVHWGTNSSLIPLVYNSYDGQTLTNQVNTGSNYLWSINSGLSLAQEILALDKNIRYYFSVTATGTNGLTSIFSEEVQFQASGRPPRVTNMRISKVPVYVLDMYFSDIPGSWDTNRMARFVLESDKHYQYVKVTNWVTLVDGIKSE